MSPLVCLHSRTSSSLYPVGLVLLGHDVRTRLLTPCRNLPTLKAGASHSLLHNTCFDHLLQTTASEDEPARGRRARARVSSQGYVDAAGEEKRPDASPQVTKISGRTSVSSSFSVSSIRISRPITRATNVGYTCNDFPSFLSLRTLVSSAGLKARIHSTFSSATTARPATSFSTSRIASWSRYVVP